MSARANLEGSIVVSLHRGKIPSPAPEPRHQRLLTSLGRSSYRVLSFCTGPVFNVSSHIVELTHRPPTISGPPVASFPLAQVALSTDARKDSASAVGLPPLSSPAGPTCRRGRLDRRPRLTLTTPAAHCSVSGILIPYASRNRVCVRQRGARLVWDERRSSQFVDTRR